MAGAIRTHSVNNPTGAGITVGANTVGAHSKATLTIADSDAAQFASSGATCAQISPGVADAAHIAGYTFGVA